MCGRFLLFTPSAEICRIAGVGTPLNLQPRFNIAPTQDAPVVRLAEDGDSRVMAMLRWGLVPGWAKDLSIGAKMINARAETVAEKPSFRGAFAKRRCLVPADGFYEWQATAKAKGQPKQPFLIVRADRKPFFMAGLWELWKGPDGPVESFTILTTDAHPSIAPIHHRMPVMLPADAYQIWLDTGSAPADLTALLRPFDAAPLAAVPISTRVNKVQNDDATLIEAVDVADEPVPEGPAQQSLF